MVTNLQQQFKDNLERTEVENNRREMNKLINSLYTRLDQSVFKKSTSEKEEVWAIKAKWKQDMIKAYPDPVVRKKQFNLPSYTLS